MKKLASKLMELAEKKESYSVEYCNHELQTKVRLYGDFGESILLVTIENKELQDIDLDTRYLNSLEDKIEVVNILKEFYERWKCLI